MLERINPVLRIVCLLLGGLFLYQAATSLRRTDPLKDFTFGVGISLASGPEAKPAKGTNGPPGSAAARKGNDLPAPIQARVDTIIQSEILGVIARPLPMALIGIAGEHALLRVPTGQTALMREGQELGGVKVLKLGPNRVLVEENGEKKELTIFSGLGGETLLPKGDKQ